jgi:hypothetical protein
MAVAVPAVAPEFRAAAIARGLFSLSFASQSGKSYTVQFKNSLNDPAWTDLEKLVGTGANLSITDPDAARQPARFYRVILTP